MLKYCVLILVLGTLYISLIEAVSDIKKCASVKKPSDEEVFIAECDKPPCKLFRKTKANMEFTFTPEKDVPALTNTVFARIAGLPLPFIGVDGSDACTFIHNEAGEKIGCPLKKGQKYIYKNVINVLPIYPKVNVEVHWALTDGQGKDIFCFEVPAQITDKKRS